MNKTYYYVGGVFALLIAGLFIFMNLSKPSSTGFATNIASSLEEGSVEVFYSSSCGCCVNYIGYLKQNGLSLKATQVADVNSVKDSLGVPSNMRSCHSVVIGDYFVEGHVPIEAVAKLLSETPDIDGIALPGMPSGAPGMPGSKGALTVYSIKDGQVVGVFDEL